MDLFTIGFVICLLSGIGCFWLFFNCIDWFDSCTVAGTRDSSDQVTALQPFDETSPKNRNRR